MGKSKGLCESEKHSPFSSGAISPVGEKFAGGLFDDYFCHDVAAFDDVDAG